MKHRIHSLIVIAVMLAVAGSAVADITVHQFQRIAEVYITHCDSILVLDHAVEWGLPEGEFSSDLSISLLSTVSASQHSMVTNDGNELQIAGSGSTSVVRTTSGACEHTQANSSIIIYLSVSESSILSVDNHDFVSAGSHSDPLFMVRDVTTGAIVFQQETVDYSGEIQLETGVEYMIRLDVYDSDESDGPFEGSASFDFDISIAPTAVAVDRADWTRVRALFH